MWYKALWSPNLIQNHNKKEFHTSFEINLFWGNVPLCNALQSYQMTQIHKKSQKLFFPAINWSKCTIVPENGGTPTFPHVFQIFRPRSLYHIPNVIIPTLVQNFGVAWDPHMNNFHKFTIKIWNFLKLLGWLLLPWFLWPYIILATYKSNNLFAWKSPNSKEIL